MAKPKTEDGSEEAKKVVDETKEFLDKILEDLGKASATKQLLVGTASGWVTGFITMKMGKVAAAGIGAGIILLHIASQKGYIDINWDKIEKNVDKISDKIEKQTTGNAPDWFEKVERFVDRKIDKAEDLLKKKEKKAKKWFYNFTRDDRFHITETHIFLTSFVAGMAIGILCGK